MPGAKNKKLKTKTKMLIQPKNIIKHLKNLILVFFAWTVFGTLLVYFGLLYFSDVLFKSVIQERVYAESSGLYQIDFSELKIDLLNRTLLIKSLEISPDTILYNKMIVSGKYNKPAYYIKLDSFYFDKLRFFNLLHERPTLNVHHIFFISPDLKLLISPNDSVKVEKKSEYQIIREEFFPLVFKYLYSLQIDKITLRNGNLNFMTTESEKSERFSADNITLTLNKFDINRDNFQTPVNLLYTDDIELKIDGYSLNLKDKIHVLSAENIYVSTKNREISMDNTHFSYKKEDSLLLISKKENFFDIQIPHISLEDADFESIYLKRIIDLPKIKISDADIKFYNKKKETDTAKVNMDFYKIIEGSLEYLKIDSFIFNEAKLNIYDNINSHQPRTNIESFTLMLSSFLIDSTSYKNTENILSAKYVYFYIKNFSHFLKDNIHNIRASELILNSQQKSVVANKLVLEPINKLFATLLYKNINKINIPQISMQGVNLAAYYNAKHLFINTLNIISPHLDIKTLSLQDDSTKKEKDYQKILSNLTKDYLKSIYIQKVFVDSAEFVYEKISAQKQTLTSCKTDIKLIDFRFFPQQTLAKTFDIKEMEIIFTEYKLVIPKSLHVLNIDSIVISSSKDGINMTNINLCPLNQEQPAKYMMANNKNMLINISIPHFNISETNIHNSFKEDTLKINNINLLSATIEINVLNDAVYKLQKDENITAIKQKSLDKINKLGEYTKIDLFLSQYQLDSIKLDMLKYKQTLIDSIKSFALNNVKKISISEKKFNISDSSILDISEIERITLFAFTFLKDNNLQKTQIDSILNLTVTKISYIGNANTTKILNKEEIYSMLASFVHVIDIKKISIEDGILIYNEHKTNKKTEIFKNSFAIHLHDFYFDYDTIAYNNKFLFSKDLEIKLKDYTINFKDNVHKMYIKEVNFSSEKSLLELNNITLSPRLTTFIKTPNLIYGICDKIEIADIDLLKIYNQQEIVINSMRIKEPFISINHDPKYTKDSITRKTLTQLLLPRNIKKVEITDIFLDTCRIEFINNKNGVSRKIIKTACNLQLNNFLIDSISYLAQNPLGLPISNFIIEIFDFNYYMKDEIHCLKAENIKYQYDNKIAYLTNLQFTYDKADSLSANPKIFRAETNYFNINIPIMQIDSLDIAEIRNKNILYLDKIYAEKVAVKIFKLKSTSFLDSMDLESIDLYKFTKNIFKDIKIQNITADNAKIDIYKSFNTNKPDTEIDNLSAEITNLFIDESSKYHRDRFLFAENLLLKINNFTRDSKDSAYNFRAEEIALFTKDASAYINGYSLKPNHNKTELAQKIYGYQKSVYDFSGEKITIENIDLKQLIKSRKFICKKIIVADSDFDFYKNKAPMYNDTLFPTNPIDLLKRAKNYIKIDSLLIKNSRLTYEELSEGKTETGIFNIEEINGYISNITNDNDLIINHLTLFAEADFLLLGEGKTHVSLEMPLYSNDNRYELLGNIADIDATKVNDFTTNTMSIAVNKGNIKRMTFKLTGNDSISKCDMRFIYNNLSIDIMETENKVKKRRRLLSFLLNRAIDQSNYKLNSKVSVTYIHNQKRSIVYNWLQAVLKGVTATLAGNKIADKVEQLLIKSRLKKQKQKEEDLLKRFSQ